MARTWFSKWLQKSTKISDILNCNIKTSAEQRQFILPNNFNYDFYMNVSLFPNKITVTCSFNSKHFVWFTGYCLPKLEEALSKLSWLWLYFNGHQSCGLFVFKFRNTTLSYLIWNIPSVGRYFKITFTFISPGLGAITQMLIFLFSNFLIFLFSNFLKSFVQCNALQIKSKHKFGKYLHERFKKIRKLENKHLLVAPKTRL